MNCSAHESLLNGNQRDGVTALRSACVIIAGPIASGKTTALRLVMASLAEEGRNVRAILQPAEARREDGKALGFSVELLAGTGGKLSARRERLAWEADPGERIGDDALRFGRFCFAASAFRLAEEHIREAVEGPRRAEIIGIDEIGRLELERGTGLRNALDLALAGAARPEGPLLVVSTRDDYAPTLQHYIEDFGIGTSLAEASDPEACLRAVRGLLQR